MPSPLSSQTSSSGSLTSWWSYQPAALSAAVALAWLTEASPKDATTTASAGQGPVTPRRAGARVMPKAMPTARGRCEAMVEVVGMMFRSARPNTLCRPPAIGSLAEATTPRSTSRAASIKDSGAAAAARARKKPADR